MWESQVVRGMNKGVCSPSLPWRVSVPMLSFLRGLNCPGTHICYSDNVNRSDRFSVLCDKISCAFLVLNNINSPIANFL